MTHGDVENLSCVGDGFLEGLTPGAAAAHVEADANHCEVQIYSETQQLLHQSQTSTKLSAESQQRIGVIHRDPEHQSAGGRPNDDQFSFPYIEILK